MKVRRCPRLFLTLVALVLAFPIGWTVEAQAQTRPAIPPEAGSVMPQQLQQKQQVEGKIAGVDLSQGKLLLDDGTQLKLPPDLNVRKGALKEGAIVKASYEVRGAERVVTSLEVQQP